MSTIQNAVRVMPRVVTLRIIGECNLRCPFCFGPRHELGAVDIDKLIKIIPLLVEHKVEAVTITGGEPLMVPGFKDLVQALSESSLDIYLSTNGLLLHRHMDHIMPYINMVGLPLDGSTPELNAIQRVGNKRHFSVVRELIPHIRTTYPNVILKVGTVVSDMNKHDVHNIPAVLYRDDGLVPNFWKIYQVIYSVYGADNKDMLTISDEEFEVASHKAQITADEHNLPLEIFWKKYRKGNYLLFEPTGTALYTSGDKEVSLGNYLDNFDGVVANWQNKIHYSQVLKANRDAEERFNNN